MAQNSDNDNDCSDCNIDSNKLSDNKESDEQMVINNDNEIKSQNNSNNNDFKRLNDVSNDLSSSVNNVMDSEQNSMIDTICVENDIKSDSNTNQNMNSDEQNNETIVENVLISNNNNESNDNNENMDSNNDSSDDSNTDDEEEEGHLLRYDPTPSVAYPSVKWHSLQQLQQREYGKLYRPGNKRPFNTYDSQWFRRYAYNSLYFFQRLELMGKFEEHNGCVNCLNFNSSGDLLLSGSDDLRIAIWDWQKSHLKHVYHSGHSSNVFQCRWCVDDHHIVSCARDGQAAAHKLTLTSPQVILSCGEDAVVFEIDLRADKPNKLLIVKNAKENKVPLYSINSNMVFNPMHFAISGRDPFVRIYDRRFLPSLESATVNPVLSLCPENLKQTKHSVTCAQYNSTADKLLSTYNDEDIYTFNTRTGLVEHTYRGHRNSATVKGCSWFGEDFIVSGSDDGYVYGWDTQSQHIVMSLYADENGVVNCIEPHPTTPIMATSGLDDNVKIWVPSADEWPQTMKGIKQRICTNVKERKGAHRRLADLDDDDAVDASMLYLIIQHMRRQRSRARRRRTGANTSEANEEEEDEDNDGDNVNNDDDEETDSGSDTDNGGQPQCIQS